MLAKSKTDPVLTNENPWRLVAEEQMSIATAPGMNEKAVTDDFEEIFREHYQLVYRAAYGVTGSRQDAEDVLQTIFLRLVQREVSPDLKTSPRKYLYRAAINAALDTVRNRKRQRLTDAFEPGDFPAADAGSNSKERIQQCLVDAMAQLSPQAVQILILRYQQGYSDAQIAAMLGKSRGVIAVTLYLFGLLPLINAMDNPRIATLRGPDILGRFASGFCFGIGLALLLVGLIFRGE